MGERIYMDLRGLMVAQGETSKSLARAVGVSATHISDILTGRRFPRTDLCYDILKHLNKEPSDIYLYFPPKGKRVEVPAQRPIQRGQPVIRVGRAG
jgi:transcriptional regulator with XRE-family HTH domain